jgi:hypothetical protein
MELFLSHQAKERNGEKPQSATALFLPKTQKNSVVLSRGEVLNQK